MNNTIFKEMEMSSDSPTGLAGLNVINDVLNNMQNNNLEVTSSMSGGSPVSPVMSIPLSQQPVSAPVPVLRKVSQQQAQTQSQQQAQTQSQQQAQTQAQQHPQTQSQQYPQTQSQQQAQTQQHSVQLPSQVQRQVSVPAPVQKSVSFQQPQQFQQPPLKSALRTQQTNPSQSQPQQYSQPQSQPQLTTTNAIKSELLSIQNKIESGEASKDNTNTNTNELAQQNADNNNVLPSHMFKLGKFKAPKQTLLLLLVLLVVGGGLFYVTRDKKNNKDNKDKKNKKNKEEDDNKESEEN